ncbi:ricin-type beta-trefoil lectin domain protein [Streptomyces sp. PTD5-9]|uniref:ricin-type beta-trefoil lectin domain protein n=1 Tax=Streptomyces sp. PTD5-9 TaxID=3120150 RepID=UPI003008E025
MADQRLLDVFDGDGEEERLWEALSSFKKTVRGLVEKTGLSTNVLADMHGFGKGKVATWQNPKREGPNIPPLRFVEVLIKEAQERANLQDGPAAVFLHQYGELLKLYCARANPHNVHRQMLLDYENTLLIRELNNATNAALERIAALTEELETLREDRDGERRRRITLQQQIDSLNSQNQDRGAKRKAALAQRDQIRADLTTYENDQQLEKWQPGTDQGGSHTHHPHEPAPPLPPPPNRGTRRRGLVPALVAAGVLVVSLAVYAGTQLHGDPDAKGTAGSDTPSAGTSATLAAAGGGPAHGGNSSSGDSSGGNATGGNASGGNATGGNASGGNATGGNASGGNASGGNATGGNASGGNATGGNATGGNATGGDATGGNATGGKTTGGSGGSGGSGGTSGATSPKPPAPSGYFRLRDVGYSQCLTSSYLNVVFATCTDSPVTNWTAKAGSGGSYTLYNESAGQCLTVNVNVLYLADCGSKTGQNWRTGTSSTLVNLYSSMCLDESSSWPVLASCEPSKSTQHWAKEY